MIAALYRYTPGHRTLLGMVIGLLMLEGVLASLSLGAILPVVNAVVSPDADPGLPWLVAPIMELTDGRIELMLLLLGGLLIAKAAISALKDALTALVKRRLWRQWVSRLSRNALTMPYAQWRQADPGALINLSINQVPRATSFVTGMVAFISEVVAAAMLIVMAALLNVIFVLACLAAGAFAYLIGLRPLNGIAFRIGERGVKLTRSMTEILTETVQGAKDIRLLSAEGRRVAEIDLRLDRVTMNDFSGAILRIVPQRGLELLLGLFMLSIGTASMMGVVTIAAAVPTMAFFAAVFLRLAMAGANISATRIKLVNRFPSFLAVVQAAQAQGCNTQSADQSLDGATLAPLETGLALRDVHFGYGSPQNEAASAINGRGAVLNGATARLPAGRLSMLFGPSGSGKSTIAELISGLQAPARGVILADGIDITSLEPEDWRRRVGYVSQHPALFTGTLRENLTLGLSQDVAHDHEAIERVARLAGVHEFAATLPDGYDSNLGDQGGRLSGGQKCRVAIARAMLRRPKLLLLDEATGGLEPSLERDILVALKQEPNLTILLITHRRDNLDVADAIFLLRDGRLEQTRQGTAGKISEVAA